MLVDVGMKSWTSYLPFIVPLLQISLVYTVLSMQAENPFLNRAGQYVQDNRLIVTSYVVLSIMLLLPFLNTQSSRLLTEMRINGVVMSVVNTMLMLFDFARSTANQNLLELSAIAMIISVLVWLFNLRNLRILPTLKREHDYLKYATIALSLLSYVVASARIGGAVAWLISAAIASAVGIYGFLLLNYQAISETIVDGDLLYGKADEDQ